MLLRGTAIVAILTLVSRLLGFVRELLVAILFGASAIADAYFVAFRIPNLLRSIFAEGALNGAFVPVFSDSLAQSKERALLVSRAVSTILIGSTIIISVIGIIAAPYIVSLLAPGFIGTERYEICVLLTRIMFPYILFVSLVALINGALNSVNVFGASAIAQILMNMVLVIGACAAMSLEAYDAAEMLAWSVLVGGLLQVLAQLPKLNKNGLSIIPTTNIFLPEIKLIGKLFLGALLGAAVYQITIFIGTQLASLLPSGSVAALSYADRLVQLPIGVFSLALSSVLLPILSRAHATQDGDAFEKNLLGSLRYSTFLLIPLSVCIMVLSEPLVRLLFERGKFTAEDSKATAELVRFYAIGIWGVSCHSIAVRGINALKDTLTPSIIGTGILLCSTILSIFFMGRVLSTSWFGQIISTIQNTLPSSPYSLGATGLALSSSITFSVAFLSALLVLWAKKNFKLIPLGGTFLTSLGASGVGAFFAVSFIPHSDSDLIHCISRVALFFVGWLITIFFSQSPEFNECGKLFRNFLRNRSNSTS